MKKIVRLTEEDLVRIVKKVIAEQAVVGISAPKAPAPSKPAQLSSTISSGGIKTNPQEFYKNFPCMKAPGVKLVNGKYMFKGKVLLPEELPYNDSLYQQANNRPDVYKKQIGKVQGGGYYFCSTYFSDGTGLVMIA